MTFYRRKIIQVFADGYILGEPFSLLFTKRHFGGILYFFKAPLYIKGTKFFHKEL